MCDDVLDELAMQLEAELRDLEYTSGEWQQVKAWAHDRATGQLMLMEARVLFMEGREGHNDEVIEPWGV